MSWTTELVALPLSKQTTPEFSLTVEEATRASSDALLQASRRLDWRFLLPDPNLARVAYVGLPASSLLSALNLFSTTVQVFEPITVEQHAVGGQYDVVVASDPTVWGLQQAVALVGPGGCLYIEVCSPLQSLRSVLRSGLRRQWGRPGLGRPLDYIKVIRKLGLRTAEPYCFWPNLEACTKIIPLRDQDALLHALAPRQAADSAIGRWQTQSGRWLVQRLHDSGLLELVVPCFGIVAQ